ncbi:hypothetical protein COOONC_21172 [Cooperia oncophora]
MASSTWVSPEEYERREKYLRAGLREVDLMDPYTWSRPASGYCCALSDGAAAMFGLMLVTARLYDIWNKKPFYFGKCSLNFYQLSFLVFLPLSIL